MKLDNLSIPVFSSNDIFDLIYQGKIDVLQEILADSNDSKIIEFNKQSNSLKLKLHKDLDIDFSEFDSLMQKDWFMPKEYQTMDIEGFLVHVCPKENYQRLIEELQEFRSRNMIDLLRWLKYFVDTMRKNNIVWGVGRGSSVASYTLFLLGVHRIDSIKYNLDWREFLR